MSRKILILFSFCTGLLLTNSIQARKSFTIGNTHIVISREPDNSVRLAATELQYFIHQTTGFRPLITTESSSKDTKAIFVGKSPYTEKMKCPDRPFKEQEYLIDVTSERIILMGQDENIQPEAKQNKGRDNNGSTPENDRPILNYSAATGGSPVKDLMITLPSIYDAQGTCYAVYDFIERFLGVRFFGPHPDNVFIPAVKEIEIDQQQIRRAPAIKHRHTTYTFDWPIIKEQYMDADKEMQQLFIRRLRIGGRKWAANHAFTGYQARFFQKNPDKPELFESYHPEYFAKGRNGGASERQFCYTNPEFIRQVAKDAIDYFNGAGTIGEQVALGDYFAVVPLDNANWCMCDECQRQLALDKGNITGTHFNCGTATHYIWNFINNVAKEVKKEVPDKKIAALAYHVYAYLPDNIQLENNIAVAPCLHPRNYWAPGMEKNEMAFYKAWIKEAQKSGREIYLWNYLCFPTERGLVTNFNVFPGFNIHKTGEQIRMYAKDQVQGIFLCGTGELLDFYITMKLMDNPTLDTDELTNDFFYNYFGHAATSMKDFYTKIESVYSHPDNYPENIRTEDTQFHQTEEIAWKSLGTKKVMDELEKMIENAQQEVRGRIERSRVESWTKGVWNYMQEGYNKYNRK